jgi:hypothetical protein
MVTDVSTVNVRRLAATEEAAYRQFLDSSPNASIYASLEYRSFLEAIVPGRAEYLLADDGARITGALPMFVHRAAEGTIVNSLPWYGSHGGCVLADGADDRTRQALLEEYVRRVAALEAVSATLILLPSEEAAIETYRRALRPTVEDFRIGQVTHLPDGGDAPEERLADTLQRKTRNLVRKALRQPFACHVRDDDEAWRFLYETHAVNLAAIGGRAKPWPHFEALREHMPRDSRRLYVVSDGDRAVAALLLLYYRDTVEYLTPVVDAAYRSRQALSFVIHAAMLDAIREGRRRWNWGGTWPTQQTLMHFKSGWGAAESRYSYLVNAPNAAARLSPLKPRLADVFPYYYVYPYDRL